MLFPVQRRSGDDLIREVESMAEQGTMQSLSVVESGKATERPQAQRAKVSELSRIINERYREFGRLQQRLEERSAKFHRWAVVGKILLVVLGALSAANASAQLFDPGSSDGALGVALVGMVVAITAGLDAAFKPEKVGGELAGLAAEVASTRGLIELTWDRVLLEHSKGTVSGDGRQLAVKSAEDLLQRLSIKLNEVNARASSLGVPPATGDASLRPIPGTTGPTGTTDAGRAAA
jgi:hypothetical protein